MQTILALFAISSSISAANIPERPQWQPTYRDAYLSATQSKKPLAVFFGSGSVNDFDVKVHELLKQKYVCVFVNVQSEAGANLAKSFAVASKGLVIGDKTGASQAFHHSGELSKDLLVKALERYADQEVATTESVANLETKKPAVQINSSCPSCQYQSNCPGGYCPR